MGLFGHKKPLTREQFAAMNAKKRIGGVKDEIKHIRSNRFDIENKLKRNNAGMISPQEQAVIVEANRSIELSKNDISSLPVGDRNTQVSLILERQREKLIKKENDLEFQKGKLEIEAKQK